MNKLFFAAAVAAAAMASPSFAALPSCAVSGLDDIVPNAQACVGYFDKNVLKTNAGDLASAEEVDALNDLNLFGTIKVIEKLTNSGDFITPLNGLTWIGVHYGKGGGPVDTQGGVTAFYRFDAGTNLDYFTFTNGSVSGVSLYYTGGAVPEPATWAMMIAGIAMTGVAMRRRRIAISFS